MTDIQRHLSGEPIGRLPVWMMRQAGRYLPSYRQIREKHSFWEMVTSPAIAAEVTLLPVRELPVDAAILFSDILTLPYGLGINIELKESIGPVVKEPLKSIDQFKAFQDFNACEHTGFVKDAIGLVRSKLPSQKTLICFAGGPWTVGCYLTEGAPSKHFYGIKTWSFEDPESLAGALQFLSDATFRYIKMQVESGAQMIQVFDTWLSLAPREFVVTHYLPQLTQLFSQIRKLGVPSIYFAKECLSLLPNLSTMPVDILGIDSSITLSEAEKFTGARVSLQGNLDPVLLLGREGTVRRNTRLLVNEARLLQRPPILNLGHGILPKTPVQNARAFLEEAQTLWI